MTRKEALDTLQELHYGIISAMGLLAMADVNGTHTDGSTVIRSNKRGYRIEIHR